MTTKSKCGCTGAILCDVAKDLWNKSSFKNRTLYSNHRCIAIVLYVIYSIIYYIKQYYYE